MSASHKPQESGMVGGVASHLHSNISRLLQAMSELETVHDRLLGPSVEACDAVDAGDRQNGEMGDLVAESVHLDAAVDRLAELVGRMSRI